MPSSQHLLVYKSRQDFQNWWTVAWFWRRLPWGVQEGLTFPTCWTSPSPPRTLLVPWKLGTQKPHLTCSVLAVATSLAYLASGKNIFTWAELIEFAFIQGNKESLIKSGNCFLTHCSSFRTRSFSNIGEVTSRQRGRCSGTGHQLVGDKWLRRGCRRAEPWAFVARTRAVSI